MNEKIALSISLALLISFSSLLFFTYSFPDSTQYREHVFYSQKFNPDVDKIFLLGSSQVSELNTTLINEKIINHRQNYFVYNLSYPSDTPVERIKTIDTILAAKPKLIIYGFSYRDLEQEDKNKILPDVHKFITNILLKNQIINVDIPNPKLISLTAIHDISKNHKFSGSKDIHFQNDTPFYSYVPNDMKTSSYEELKQDPGILDASFIDIAPPSKNQQVLVLSEIIQKCKENNVKIIIFTTPMHRLYLNELPQSQKAIFNSTINYIRNTSNVEVYDLTEKYADELIFTNTSHVSHNKNAVIYSQDLAEIITNEIKS